MNFLPGWHPPLITRDPFFSQVVLLVHANGADGSTTLLDSSRYRRTLTASDGAQIDTAQFKFGGASLFLDDSGTGQAVLTAADSADFTLGTLDWTIEMWRRGFTTAEPFASQYDPINAPADSAWRIDSFDKDGTVTACVYHSTSSTVALKSTTVLNSTSWYHIALTRSGSNIRLFIDGVLEDTDSSIGGGSINNSSELLRIGAEGSFFVSEAHFDDFRMTVGTARYTASFTPPGAQFPDQ